ncbi:MAG: NifB/NifX family molybdenum-iron cluster-binding protein [Peptococcaceae bacterium]
MRIAVPSQNNQVDNHFGHCQYFTIFTVDETKKIINAERMDSPVGCGCKSNIAVDLANTGVTVMLAGSIGDGAVRILNSCGIEVVRGCSGDLQNVVEGFIKGTITDSGEICTEHGHECHHEQ